MYILCMCVFCVCVYLCVGMYAPHDKIRLKYKQTKFGFKTGF